MNVVKNFKCERLLKNFAYGFIIFLNHGKDYRINYEKHCINILSPNTKELRIASNIDGHKTNIIQRF